MIEELVEEVLRTLFISGGVCLICGSILLALLAVFCVVAAFTTRIIARSVAAIRRNIRIILGREPSPYPPLFKEP